MPLTEQNRALVSGTAHSHQIQTTKRPRPGGAETRLACPTFEPCFGRELPKAGVGTVTRVWRWASHGAWGLLEV